MEVGVGAEKAPARFHSILGCRSTAMCAQSVPLEAARKKMSAPPLTTVV